MTTSTGPRQPWACCPKGRRLTCRLARSRPSSGSQQSLVAAVPQHRRRLPCRHQRQQQQCGPHCGPATHAGAVGSLLLRGGNGFDRGEVWPPTRLRPATLLAFNSFLFPCRHCLYPRQPHALPMCSRASASTRSTCRVLGFPGLLVHSKREVGQVKGSTSLFKTEVILMSEYTSACWKGITVTEPYYKMLFENTMLSQLFLPFCLEHHCKVFPSLSFNLKLSIPFPKSWADSCRTCPGSGTSPCSPGTFQNMKESVAI